MSIFSHKTWLIFILPLVLCFLAGALISEILQWRRLRREGTLSAGDVIGGTVRCAASVLWIPLGIPLVFFLGDGSWDWLCVVIPLAYCFGFWWFFRSRCDWKTGLTVLSLSICGTSSFWSAVGLVCSSPAQRYPYAHPFFSSLGMISVILFFSLLILYAFLRLSPKRRSFSAFAWDIGVALLFFFPFTLLFIRLINWADTLV